MVKNKWMKPVMSGLVLAGLMLTAAPVNVAPAAPTVPSIPNLPPASQIRAFSRTVGNCIRSIVLAGGRPIPGKEAQFLVFDVFNLYAKITFRWKGKDYYVEIRGTTKTDFIPLNPPPTNNT